MTLLSLFKQEALKRGLLDQVAELDAGTVFRLVRDMPYQRASDRRPATIISEWRGTCSGKHYLLKELFAELGLNARIVACTTIVPIDKANVPESMLELYEAANGCFVDVHNYLLVRTSNKHDMVVDATWPVSARNADLVVNEVFVLGEDQRIAAEPLETWLVPDHRDPQEYKDELLQANFTAAELEFREEVIRALGDIA